MDTPLHMPADPFWIDPPPNLLGRAITRVARPLLSRLLGLEALKRSYLAASQESDVTFLESALRALQIEVDVSANDLRNIPPTGPAIIAANHPRGALDGLVLGAVVARLRPDTRVLANYWLHRIPELRPLCFFVDPFGGPFAEARSRAGLRAAHLWLRQGGTLIMFPAGEVSFRRDASGHLVERPWHETLGRMAVRTGATVVPASIGGSNSRLFYAAGRVHPHFRTALLARELMTARRSRVQVRFTPRVEASGDAGGITRRAQHLACAQPDRAASLRTEITRLPPDATLVDAGRYQVLCATAVQIPETLQEIGRLRAVTYQQAGEGTGTAIDLDTFDGKYFHLFVWDRSASMVVGAYRLGRADLLARNGADALYTRSLFDYGPELLEAIGPALELGRSFVRPEYQRNYQALLLLWRGIGAFVVRNPHYRTLFGPVSISAAYSDASLTLLTTFLEQNHLDSSLAHKITPLHPRPARLHTVTAVPSDLEAVNRRVAQLERDGRGMPVLLRQYLKLNARVLGFSIDPAFGNVVDALMAIDLLAANPAILRRYLGDEGLSMYLRHHRASHNADAA